MNKYLFSLVAPFLVVTLLAGCKPPSSTPPELQRLAKVEVTQYPTSILGEWRLKSVAMPTGIFLNEPSLQNKVYRIGFTNDRLFITREGDATASDNGSYLIDGSQLVLQNKLKTEKGQEVKVTIREMNRSELVVELSSKDKEPSTVLVHFARTATDIRLVQLSKNDAADLGKALAESVHMFRSGRDDVCIWQTSLSFAPNGRAAELFELIGLKNEDSLVRVGATVSDAAGPWDDEFAQITQQAQENVMKHFLENDSGQFTLVVHRWRHTAGNASEFIAFYIR